MQKEKIYKKAFSLIELSIVILIVSILITGVLSTSISSINNAKIRVTNDRMAEIYKALGSYLVINKKLPCPASLILAKTDVNYGNPLGVAGTCTTSGVYLSTSGGATSLVYGMVPVKVLGLSSDMAEDGFGSKISYIVHKDFTTTWTSATGGHTTTAPYDPGAPIILIQENPSGVTNTAFAIFSLVSHGANKYGAFNALSTTQNARSADADEQNNDTGNVNNGANTADFNYTFISSSTNSDTFDDIVLFKTRTQVVQDFNAYSAIPCAAGMVTITGIPYNMPAGDYNQNVVSTSPACTAINPTYTHGPATAQIKCNAFGVWGTTTAVPCS